MTLQGRLHTLLTPHNSKVKSHLKVTELDINASQACLMIIMDGDKTLPGSTVGPVGPYSTFLRLLN